MWGIGGISRRLYQVVARRCSSAFSTSVQRRDRSRIIYMFAGLLTGTLCGLGFASHFKLKEASGSKKDSGRKQAETEEQSITRSSSHSIQITMEEVAKHTNEDTGIWVTYKGAVYDVTEFAPFHRGGEDLVVMVGGSSLEPYWAIFDFHQNYPVIMEKLEKYRVGILVGGEAEHDKASWPDDPYTNDPTRHPDLQATTAIHRPYVAFTPAHVLGHSLVTPNEVFYVRNHCPVPDIDADEYRLEVLGEGREEVSLSLEDLKKKFRKHTVMTTVECAGSRVSGGRLISTAQWGGVLLRDVLLHAGIDEEVIDESGYGHLHLEGADADFIGTHYEVSIPIHTATSTRGDVLLAYEMNGEDVPRDHGYPLRCIVPGTAGARNVKWLGRITASQEESSSLWQRKDYKVLPPGVNEDDSPDFSAVPAIQELPVNSLICHPQEGSTLSRSAGTGVTVSGYAFSGGGREIIRVDVSMDGGNTWSVANLNGAGQATGRAWAWTLWETSLPLPSDMDEIGIICKAVDRSYNVQPDTAKPISNLRGYVTNPWHRVKVNVSD